jgi:hypothetical protein
MDIEEPRRKKSKTAREEPKRPIPNTDTDAARRTNERIAKEAPMCEKSRTAIVAPKRAILRNDRELPS